MAGEINPSAIDNAPIFQLLTSIVMEGPGKLLNLAGRAAADIGEGLGSIGSIFGNVKETLLGGAMSLGSGSGLELAPSRTIEPQIAQQTQYDVPMAELGNLAPPSVGAKSVGGIGMNV